MKVADGEGKSAEVGNDVLRQVVALRGRPPLKVTWNQVGAGSEIGARPLSSCLILWWCKVLRYSAVD